MSATGRRERAFLRLGGTARSAKGAPVSPSGRPEGEYRRAQRDGSPLRPARHTAGPAPIVQGNRRDMGPGPIERGRPEFASAPAATMLRDAAPARAVRPGIGARQQGIALFVALIVMVALGLVAVALIRSVDTTTSVVGNLGFRQASILPASRAVEEAVAALFEPPYVIADKDADDVAHNYFASIQAGADRNGVPRALQTLADYPSAARTLPDDAGNTVRYVIERVCNAAGEATPTRCDLVAPAPIVGTTTGESNRVELPRIPLYRLTVRVDGPRNTVSFAQAMLR
jgi:type IV pilus assembly protein PilX